MRRFAPTLAILLVSLVAGTASAESVTLKDPKGDDNGPGTYVYPTDPAYKPGSFDLTEVTIEDTGSEIQVSASFAVAVEDPWRSKEWQGNGFSLQMVFLLIDTDHKTGSDHKDGAPGLNVRFAEASRWEKCLILSPQPNRRLQSEIASKAKGMSADLVLPKKVRVQGRKIIATYDKGAVGAPVVSWGYQAIVQSNEGFPSKNDLLTRPINEMKGLHRFDGGNDYSCDPHVLDMLAEQGSGAPTEKDAQYTALKTHQCTDDEDGGVQAEISAVYP